MKPAAYHILRVGTAVTFLWIGVLILKDTVSFSALLEPWALKLLGLITNNLDDFLRSTMIEIAILDLAIGFCLLINRFVLIASGLGFLHLLSIVISTSILVTVRDIGLMAAALALFFTILPSPFVRPKTFKEWLELLAK